jgi:hypothetical protein
MKQYEFPARRSEQDVGNPASGKIGGLLAGMQESPTKPELMIMFGCYRGSITLTTATLPIEIRGRFAELAVIRYPP